jgi:hypothetical protein
MKKPIIGISPNGKEYLFPSINAALYFQGYKGGTYTKEITRAVAEGKEFKGWKFRELDNIEKDYYEKVLCKQGGSQYGADPRPESSPADSGE